MTLLQSLLTFIPAATIMAMTPGVDTAMVLRSATIDGSRPAAFAVAGIGLGCLIWGSLVSVGLGALLAASPIAFAVLKYAGAAYLLWLGLGLLLKPRATLDEGGGSRTPMSAMTALRRGLLTNLLNPKVGVFYVTFLPQFIPPGADAGATSFLLALIHVVIGFLWLSALVVATAPLGHVLRRPAVIRTMDRLTGGVFVGFGLKLALSRQA